MPLAAVVSLNTRSSLRIRILASQHLHQQHQHAARFATHGSYINFKRRISSEFTGNLSIRAEWESYDKNIKDNEEVSSQVAGWMCSLQDASHQGTYLNSI